MLVWNGVYWLFASKSGGYWHSNNMLDWNFIEPTGLPLEAYAPTVLVHEDKLYYTAYDTKAIFVTDDPMKGVWSKAGTLSAKYGDPFLFKDDDGAIYMVHGCSNVDPIKVVELDPRNGWKEKGESVAVVYGNETREGWEDTGPKGSPVKPWIEGAWVTKYEGAYYLQHAAPGTSTRYGDGLLVSTTGPKGPYLWRKDSPFSHKPSGFLKGAGHGSTFQDLEGRWWHVATSHIGVRHRFERRISMHPAHFVKNNDDGTTLLYADTKLADYPIHLDQRPRQWMLLSYKKEVKVSSVLDPKHEAGHAVDEDIRTWWSAKTGDADEFIEIDLGADYEVHALQINFADQDADAIGPAPANEPLARAYRYSVNAMREGDIRVNVSAFNRTNSVRDSPHSYTALDEPVTLRWLRVTAIHVPANAKFSVSGLRVFGLATTKRAPDPVTSIRVIRDATDKRRASVSWEGSKRAQFYIVRWGAVTHEGVKLPASSARFFQSEAVYGATTLETSDLIAGVPYEFVIDAVNEAGVTPMTTSAVGVSTEDGEVSMPWESNYVAGGKARRRKPKRKVPNTAFSLSAPKR